MVSVHPGSQLLRTSAEACTVALSSCSSGSWSDMQDPWPHPRPTESEFATNKIQGIHFEKLCSRSTEISLRSTALGMAIK